jgi:hypothetical protein
VRTVYLVEVPNFGHATPLSQRQVTPSTLCDVIELYCPDHELDIFCHSFGSVCATMFLNESHQRRSGERLIPQRVVFCDGFVHAFDFVRSSIYAFADHMDYLPLARGLVSSWAHRMLLLNIHSIEFQAFAKRFHNVTDGVLWREYHNVQMLHIYGTADVLFDVPLLKRKLHDSTTERFVFLDGARHGGCLFGKRSGKTVSSIREWVTADDRCTAGPI